MPAEAPKPRSGRGICNQKFPGRVSSIMVPATALMLRRSPRCGAPLLQANSFYLRITLSAAVILIETQPSGELLSEFAHSLRFAESLPLSPRFWHRFSLPNEPLRIKVLIRRQSRQHSRLLFKISVSIPLSKSNPIVIGHNFPPKQSVRQCSNALSDFLSGTISRSA